MVTSLLAPLSVLRDTVCPDVKETGSVLECIQPFDLDELFIISRSFRISQVGRRLADLCRGNF